MGYEACDSLTCMWVSSSKATGSMCMEGVHLQYFAHATMVCSNHRVAPFYLEEHYACGISAATPFWPVVWKDSHRKPWCDFQGRDSGTVVWHLQGLF